MTPPTTPGQDGGEGPVPFLTQDGALSKESSELVDRAKRAFLESRGSGTAELEDDLAAALAAVAPDLVRAERDRVRGECAAELLTAVATGYLPVEAAKFLAHRWRTPDPAS